MVGLNRAVELPPVHREHQLVLQPQMMQQHGAGRGTLARFADAELHVGQQLTGPGLCDEEGSALPLSHLLEVGGVDQADAPGQRVDAQRGPGQIEERERGDERDVDPFVGAQELHRALGHAGRPRHRIDDGTRGGRGHQLLDDRGVHLLEGVLRLVEVVECPRCPPLRPPPGDAPCAGTPGSGPASSSAAVAPSSSLPAGPRPTTVMWGRRGATVSR